MVKLERRRHGAALPLYRASPVRFPLIGAVLLDAQDGVVYVDDPDRPGQAFVEHAFGFSQYLGAATPDFEAALERHLIADKDFAPVKIRMYTPHLPAFLLEERFRPMRSFRQRFVMNARDLPPIPSAGETVVVDASNFDRFERAFGVAGRFWRNPGDFVDGANAVVTLNRGEPASMCYAAAVVDGAAEIDVITRPEHQREGMGRAAVAAFVRRCFERGLAPLWDCFANNAGSMELSRSVGFTPAGEPYPFFTINK